MIKVKTFNNSFIILTFTIFHTINININFKNIKSIIKNIIVIEYISLNKLNNSNDQVIWWL